jgi:hypothetical protein
MINENYLLKSRFIFYSVQCSVHINVLWGNEDASEKNSNIHYDSVALRGVFYHLWEEGFLRESLQYLR